MCSLTLSKITQEQLDSIGGNGQRLEDLIARKAFAANVNQPGSYDNQNTNLRAGFAEDLRQNGVRKDRVMGHRVYFTGKHTDCNYLAFFIKLNKRGDNERQDDNNPDFHEKLRRALTGEQVKTIPDPKQPLIVGQVEEEKPTWQDADWYKEYGG